MMDLRALLYVVDKVFKRVETARQKKDPDPLAEEADESNWLVSRNIIQSST